MPKFGITKETKSKNLIAFNPPIKDGNGGWKFPTAKLVQVISKEQEKKDQTTTPVLQFIFVSGDGLQTYIHTEWLIEDDAKEYDKKFEGMNSRIKHIYEAFAEFPEKGVGAGAKSWVLFFDAVAKAFNEEVDGKKLIDKNPVWIKLTYYKNNLGFPLSPNFIEPFIKDKKCRLEVNLKYDAIEQVAAPKNNGTIIPNPMQFDEENGEGDYPEF